MAIGANQITLTNLLKQFTNGLFPTQLGYVLRFIFCRPVVKLHE